MNIFIDPIIIMAPPQDGTKEEIEAWLANLDLWLKEALTSPYTWFHSKEATGQLEAAQIFPTFSLLRYWQRKYRLDINIIQIASRVNEFFRNEDFDLKRKLEELVLIEAERNSITVWPDYFYNRWPSFIQESMLVLLTTICACKHSGEPLTHQLSVATAPSIELPQKEITVSARVSASVPELKLDISRNISQKFSLLFTPDDLLPLIDVISLWSQGEKGIRYAVAQQYKKDWQTLGTEPLEYRLPVTFIDSVNKAGLDTSEVLLHKVIKAVADIIADKAKDIESYHIHPFRESETGDSPQFTRPHDHAKAWRLMLTKHGAGWRLHYWQISDRERGFAIELSHIEKEQGPRKMIS